MDVTDQTAKSFVDSVLTTTSDVGGPMRLKALILGDFGVGKTSLFRTCPKPVIIDPEHGTLPLRKEKIPRIPVRNWEQVFQALHFIRTGDHDYQTLCLDDLHDIQSYDITHILRENSKAFMTRDLWGIAKSHGHTLIQWLNAIQMQRDMHIVVNVNTKTETDDDGKIVGIAPDLQGGFREQVCRNFKVVGYLEARERRPDEEGDEDILRRVIVYPYGNRNRAKDRYTPPDNDRSILDHPAERPGICLPDLGVWIERIEAEGVDIPDDDADPVDETTPEPATMPEPEPEKKASKKAKPKAEEPEPAAEPELDLTEEEPEELPAPAELRKLIIDTYNGAKKSGILGKDGKEIHLEMGTVIKDELVKHKVAKLSELDDSLALDKIVKSLEEIETS
jgi:hypothetical protein